MSKISHKLIKFTKKLLQKKYQVALDIIKAIYENEGKAYLVGGAVRDIILERPINDIDIEVHGLSYVQLHALLLQCGAVSEIGKAFGVLRLHTLDIDWSLPRIDSFGRKPDVQIVPDLSLKEALRRRDFTINALALELFPEKYEFHDYYHGVQDIQNKILRAVDPQKFVEDPLRFFRTMRYTAVLEMTVHESLNEICKTMPLENIAQERIHAEFYAMFMRARCPARGFWWLKKIDRLYEILPELAQLNECDPEYLEIALDGMDKYSKYADKTSEMFLVSMYAFLCDDIVGPKDRVRLISRIAGKPSMKTRKQIRGLTTHVALLNLLPKSCAHVALYKILAARLDRYYLKIVHVYNFSVALCHGNQETMLLAPLFLKRVREAKVMYGPEKQILMGKDLLDKIPPSPRLGAILRKTYFYQLATGCRCIKKLRAFALRNL